MRKAAGWALAALVAADLGCSMPHVQWSPQRVSFGGRDFVFERIDSLSPSGQSVSYREGNFLVDGSGTLLVNGFQITVPGGADVSQGVVLLANQRLELKPGDEVHFDSGMQHRVEPRVAVTSQ